MRIAIYTQNLSGLAGIERVVREHLRIFPTHGAECLVFGEAGCDYVVPARGEARRAAAAARAELAHTQPLDLVNQVLIPALDRVGDRFEKGTLFLPQLLQAAGAAQAAFDLVKDAIAQSGADTVSRGKIVIATVKGDIHDIGKNIVKVILENYGYSVTDLGRDVPALDHQLCHIIASGMFNALVEVVVHEMPYDRARQYIRQLREFYTAGWYKLMGE